jgi:hypothetical protein
MALSMSLTGRCYPRCGPLAQLYSFVINPPVRARLRTHSFLLHESDQRRFHFRSCFHDLLPEKPPFDNSFQSVSGRWIFSQMSQNLSLDSCVVFQRPEQGSTQPAETSIRRATSRTPGFMQQCAGTPAGFILPASVPLITKEQSYGKMGWDKFIAVGDGFCPTDLRDTQTGWKGRCGACA